MSIQLFDTLTVQKTPFEPLQPGKVGLYVCGPTVYDLAHLGHARCYVVWDVVARHLRARGYELKVVRNYTDVDDKIIRRAAERGMPAVALAAEQVIEFERDMAILGVAPPDAAPKVSEHLPEIVALIEKLIAQGFAYPVPSGDVYYSVRKFDRYTDLSRRNLDDMLAGARVEPGEEKRDPLDFALWKTAKPGEPSWSSPWGLGRPGWHIECSAMAEKHLGVTFDIHAGGKDLIFPHHSNEIAQSEAAHAAPLARYWMHNGFVEIDKEKMAKSTGNFLSVRSLTERYHPEALRYWILGTHYRNPLAFSEQALEESERRVGSLYETLDRAEAALAAASPRPPDNATADWVTEAARSLDDDFNSAAALATLAAAFTAANALADKAGRFPAAKLNELPPFLSAVAAIGKVLGILGMPPREALRAIREKAARRRGIDIAEVEREISERVTARAAKDFARSDAIREALKSRGVLMMDTARGTEWKVE